MAIETGLRLLLLNQGSISSLCRTQTIQGTLYRGIFNEYGEQGFAPPFILIHLIDCDPMVVFGGTTGMQQSEFDIDAYAVTVPKALELADAIADYLKDYTGYAGTSDYIDTVIWQSKRIDNVRPVDGSNQIIYAASQSFLIQHHEA